VKHHPVMLDETLTALNINPNGIYIDATFGRGGHSTEILRRLGPQGRLFCIDKDPTAIHFGQERFNHDPRVTFIHGCFSDLVQHVKANHLMQKVNGLLLDLGVSSPQLDDAARGFSFLREGPLDMRMDPTQGFSAQEWVNAASAADISYVLKIYGEESFAKRIAHNIVKMREQKNIQTTSDLAQIVENSIPMRLKKPGRHLATKTFQAIRVHVNNELNAIDQFLLAANSILAPGGRLAIISFHSLEDRKVKQFCREQSKVKLPPGVAIPERELSIPFTWVIKRQRATQEEIGKNTRARSATLRVAEKNTH
jgi:16S rRNA (cytosine1402-N4)-methyltransferase